MTLEAFIMQMRQLGELPDAIAAAAAPVLEQAARENAAASRDPNGKTWAPKKDGSRPLEHAADAIHAEAAGPTVTLSIEAGAPENWHQRLKEEGRHPRRQILPSPGDPLPDYLAKPLGEIAQKTIAERLGAR